MIHGFATRGDQLYGGTGWIRQYLRAGYPVLVVNLPYHTDEYLKDLQFTVDCKLPTHTQVMSGEIPFSSVPSTNAAGERLSPMHQLTSALAQLLRAVAAENGLGVELQPRAHVIGFSFGAHRLGACAHPPRGGRIPHPGRLASTRPSHHPALHARSIRRYQRLRERADPGGRLYGGGRCVVHLDYR